MNLTRFLSFTKYTLLVAVVFFTTFFISSCDNGDDGPKIFNGTTLELIQDAQFKQSATVSADVALDSLVKYLTIYPELTAMLSGSTEYTLFAPSNSAFINLLSLPNFPQNIKLISPEIVKNVLLFHFVEGKKLKKDLTPALVLNSKFTDPLSPTAPQTITVNANGTLLAAPTSANLDIDIVKADVQSKNGVVHVVESVLIPTSIGAVLTPILGTMAATVLLGKDFTLLARLIARADAGYIENAGAGQLKISSHLARPISGTFTGATFFATPNAVFEAAATAAGAANANAFIDNFTTGGSGTARAVLLNHYVMGKYVVTATSGSTAFPAGLSTLDPLSTKTITVNNNPATISAQNPYGVTLSNTPANATTFRPIVSKDLSATAGINNGIIQVFGGILQ